MVADRIEPFPPSRRHRRRGAGGRGQAADLRAFLDRASRPTDGLSYHEAQGFLFTVAAAPDLVEPSEWVPMILGAKEPAFSAGAEAQRILGELIRSYNELVDQVATNRVELPGDCRFRDDILSNLSEDAPVSQWCRGFMQGHSWLEESWPDDLPDAVEEELGFALLTLGFFASRRLAERLLAECAGGKMSLVEMAETCRSTFPGAMASYVQVSEAIRQAMVSQEHPRAEKTGRNDPCPCGSGKKFKRCCLGATGDLMEQAARRVRRVQDEIEPRLVAFGRSTFGPDALDRARREFACGHENLGDAEDQLFHPWVLYQWTPRGSTMPVAQLYLDRHGDRLSPDEVVFLRTTCLTPTSFHEVVEVEPGRRLRLRDILLQVEHDVFEQAGSETLRVGDAVYGRVVPYDGVALIIGTGGIVLPPIEKRGAIQMRAHLRERFGEPTPQALLASDEELRRLYLGVRDRLMNPAPPVLTNTDGEPLELHTITCNVESIESAFEALAPLARGEARDELLRQAGRDTQGRLTRVELPWLKKNTVLGHLVLEGAGLTVEINSAARARRIQRELRKRLGQTMRNLTVRIKPIGEALADYDRIRDTPEERKRLEEERSFRASPEVREAMSRIIERQWDGWIDEKIPALDGLTPRQAVRRPDGREMVEALLMQFERSPCEGGEGYDFNRLRRELGLPARARTL